MKFSKPSGAAPGKCFRAVLGVAGALAAVCGVRPPTAYAAAPDSLNRIAIHLRQRRSRPILGIGVQWDPYTYPPTPGQWKIIIHRMDFMRPSFLRVMCIHLARPSRVQKPLAWAQAHGAKVILGTWWPPNLKNHHALNNILWAKRVAMRVKTLRDRYGFRCIRYYNFINEPEAMPIDRWAAAAGALHQAFHEAGLQHKVRIIGPDTYGDPDYAPPALRAVYDWPLLLPIARHAARFVGVYDIHWYPQDAEITGNVICPTLMRERHEVLKLDPGAIHKPFLMSESGLIQGRCHGDQQPRVKTFGYGVLMTDYAAEVFEAGWSGISAWDLDDALHVVRSTRHLPHPPGPYTLKLWGFWNSQGPAMGHPRQFNPRPWFYTWSLLSRLFPGGTRIIESHRIPGHPSLRLLAGEQHIQDNLKWGVVIVNIADRPQKFLLRIPGLDHRMTTYEYTYFKSMRPVNSALLPIPAAVWRHESPAHGFTVSMPGRGVIFLTNRSILASPNP